MKKQHKLEFKHFTFEELFHTEGLERLDQTFLAYLQAASEITCIQLLQYRNETQVFTPLEISDLLIKCAVYLEQFLADFFDIEEAVALAQAKTISFNPIASFKKYYVLRKAKKEFNKISNFPAFESLLKWINEEIKQLPLQTEDKELAIALLGNHYLTDPTLYAAQINKLTEWCALALFTVEGKLFTRGWTSFNLPERIDHDRLVAVTTREEDKLNRLLGPLDSFRARDGFKLTDSRMSAREVQDEVNYCIYCHDHDGDFCSKGFPVKKGDPTKGFKKNPLDITLTGCPLEEKISEMNLLKRDGHTLGALAMVMVDNPMCPATGHRICNDCMKSCIYQKQTPVNIPQIETRVLTDVLDLPWGVEIYDLLTRWNPLRKNQWRMKTYNGLKVLIAGMGPAGFTLAHHLLLEGFAVVGFDGLKIEPLPSQLIKQPIRDFKDLKESLDERVMVGFGGVAEYGITVRWDKNFLKLIYLSLARKPHFQVFGGVRFGGTVTVQDAWEMGFDHFAVAVGAGLPRALPIRGSLAPGMRQANDFLMALQLGNAAKASSLTNLQVRLPAVVIGGGLTGVDTATEAQAYYLTQVEKILHRYEILVKEVGEECITQQLTTDSKQILAEYLEHGRAVRKERQRAQENGELPNFIHLIHQWGGVTIAYRRSMQESPAYIHNHEELKKSLEEGIFYLEGLEPAAVDLDINGHSQALICKKRVRNETGEWVTSNEEVILPAKSILVATGTQPNTAYEFEHKGTFNRLNLQYQHYEDIEGELTVAHGVVHCKDENFGPFTSYHKQDKRISLIGDTHPVFHGSVVKAIASGLRTYPKILHILRKKLGKVSDEKEYQNFAEHIKHLFTASVVEISRKSNKTIELIVRAPLAAKHFKPGQFYRLQNFETFAPKIRNTLLQMEPQALVAAECQTKEGTLTFIITENTTAARLCSILKPHEPISLMGPTGVRTKIPSEHEAILIIGNQSSIPFLRSYGHELKSAGNRVLYIGLFNQREEVFCQEKLENCTDSIVWVTANGELIVPRRTSDVATSNQDVIEVILNYAKNNPDIPLNDIDRIFIVGDTQLLRTFQAARQTVLKELFVKQPKVFGSVYGNMQCMLKGVCAQCLQWQIDPETGQRTKAVFACSWQDQPLEIIDIDHIDDRLSQNRLHEQISQLWLDLLFKTETIDRV